MENSALSMDGLDECLEQIKEAFHIDIILNQNITEDFIQNYYKDSNAGYKFFHSAKGSVHMALNHNGVFNADGYYEQAKTVRNYISENTKVGAVLELGCGKGFNSVYLAGNNPTCSFVGLDLTPAFLKEAEKKGRHLPNLSFISGNFHQIPFENERFDLVFETEAVCHAIDMKTVLDEVYRILKRGGHFILFDGFRQTNFDKLDQRLITASKLVEVSMAVEKGIEIDKWIEMAKQTGFEIVVNEDISHAILPNLLRLQKLAKRFFKKKWITKFISKALSSHLVINAIAGLLMPYTIQGNAQRYYKIILKKA